MPKLIIRTSLSLLLLAFLAGCTTHQAYRQGEVATLSGLKLHVADHNGMHLMVRDDDDDMGMFEVSNVNSSNGVIRAARPTRPTIPPFWATGCQMSMRTWRGDLSSSTCFT